MLAMLISIVWFFLFLLLGNLLMVLNPVAYGLGLVYIVLLFIVRFCYQEANCNALEIKDLLITLGICLLFLWLLHVWGMLISYAIFWYLYLSVFLSLILYADSIRFKSLM